MFKGRGEKIKFVCDAESVLLVHCSVVEDILKYYCRVLNAILNKSPVGIISPICFQLNRGKNSKHNISSKNHLKR